MTWVKSCQTLHLDLWSFFFFIFNTPALIKFCRSKLYIFSVQPQRPSSVGIGERELRNLHLINRSCVSDTGFHTDTNPLGDRGHVSAIYCDNSLLVNTSVSNKLHRSSLKTLMVATSGNISSCRNKNTQHGLVFQEACFVLTGDANLISVK